MDLVAKSALSPSQAETVQRVITSLREGQQTLLGHVENERARLTSREAEQRCVAVNELCAIVLQLLPAANGRERSAEGGDHQNAKIGGENAAAITRDQIDQLLPFLLSKVEDCGHLSDVLITALHRMIKLYDGIENVLPNECLEQTITALFDGGGSVQSYGQRDRLLLFSCLDHLVATHASLLRSLIGAQRVLLAFVRAAQGEREPRALARVFALHQRMSANFGMGVLAEDMFELVACYFPIDYEPSDQERAEQMPITREQLRHSCECALLGHVAFAPFCMQLVAEKLLETEGGDDGTAGGDDGCALIRRQLEICKFFIRVCTKFRDAPNSALHEHVEDLMTAVRLLFLNPSVQQRETTLLMEITTTIDQMLHVLASALEQNASKLEDPFRFIRLMAETTLENVEPFVLQAEMGTSGRAFCLLQCLARAHPVTRALCVPRALYWLNTLITGQTLRSADNRAEIATEALALVPEWLRLCFVVDGFGLFSAIDRCDICRSEDSGGDNGTAAGTLARPSRCTRCTAFAAAAAQNADARDELISATVVPLFDSVRRLQTVCEPNVLLAVECEAHSILLLSLDTVPSSLLPSPSPDGTMTDAVRVISLLNNGTQIAQLRALCSAMANRVLPLLTSTETFDDSDACDALIRDVVQQTDSTKWARLSKVLKQFIALSAHLIAIGDRIDEHGEHQLELPDPKKWPRLVELFPALLRPLPDETEQRKITRKSLDDGGKFSAAVCSLLLSTLSAAFGTASADDAQQCAACAGVCELARRLALAPSEEGTTAARQCFADFAEKRLIGCVAEWAQQWDDAQQMEGLRRADRLAQLLQDIGTLAISAGGDANDGIHARMCDNALAIIRQQQSLLAAENGKFSAFLRALRCFWLLFLLPTASNDQKVPKLKQFATVLLHTLKSVSAPAQQRLNRQETDGEQFDLADHRRQWLIDALISVHFAMINRSSGAETAPAAENVGEISGHCDGIAQLADLLVDGPNASSSAPSPLLRLRLRAVETRNALLAEPNAAIVAERLKQFFDQFMALDDADSAKFGPSAMADLLDFHRPSSCPERCNYRRTLFWRQRLFCQFVPVFVQFAHSANCSSTKRRVLLQLLGPLLQIVDPQLIAIDTVFNEFGQLYPVIVDALVDALASPQGNGTTLSSSDQPPSSLSSSAQLLPQLLDVLRTLLQQMPPTDGTDAFVVALVPRLVRALTANIAAQTLPVQSKALECLRLLALPRLAIPPEALLPLHVCVVRVGAVLAASRKRAIRQRMARTRNAWELALA